MDMGEHASLARTALDDPGALPEDVDRGEAVVYALDHLDAIIAITDPGDAEPVERWIASLEGFTAALKRLGAEANTMGFEDHERQAFLVVEEQLSNACDALEVGIEYLRDAAAVVVNTCEDCAVNGDDCKTHGEAFRLARRAVLADPERVVELLKASE